MINIGQQATLIQPVIQGEVLDTRFNKDASELEHLLSFVDSDGAEQQRWFLSSTLEIAE